MMPRPSSDAADGAADAVAELLRTLAEDRPLPPRSRALVVAAAELRLRRRALDGRRPWLLAAAIVVGLLPGGLWLAYHTAPDHPPPMIHAEAPSSGSLSVAVGAAPTNAAPSATAPRTPDPTLRPEPRRPPMPTSAPSAQAMWSEWMSAGEFARVVADARWRGVGRCLAECSLPELRALAESARYVGEPALAQTTLETLRERFPGTPDAAEAAFLLGRVGGSSSAVRWFDTYLAEAPEGRFAEDARGGKLIALIEQGNAAARAAARDYLNRHPRGVHADRARRLLERP